MKAKVTLRIETDLLREARVVAAEQGRSVGALLSDLLAGLVRERRAFQRARRRALAPPPQPQPPVEATQRPTVGP